MARLTNAIRNEIVNTLVKATFKLRSEVLEREESKLAFEVRDAYLGEFKAAYLALPPYLQEDASYMNVQLSRLGQEHDHYFFQFHAKASLIPYYGEQMRWNSGCNMTGNGTEPCGKPQCVDKGTFDKALHAKLCKHADKWETFEEDTKKLSIKVSEQLKACTTTEKLLKAWPEVATYIPAAMNPLTVQIDRKQTNKMIACMEMGTCN